jgi:hypothetical protein
VNHCLAAIEEGGFRVPDRVFLLSPAIGITAFAKLARWDAMYGFIPYFEQSKWLDLQPEFDPYKYNSFPKNAGTQSWRLAHRIREKIGRLKKAGRLGELPPMLAFQSAVDDTILAGELITGLFDHFERNGSELVFFDINHAAGLDGFVKRTYREGLRSRIEKQTLAFTLTIVTNPDPSSNAVSARSWAPGQKDPTEKYLGLSWPVDTFSLSHVAIPFPPEDPLYGAGRGNVAKDLLQIGTLAPRGERGILRIPASQLLRMRYNPFHSYLREKVLLAISEQGD